LNIVPIMQEWFRCMVITNT